MHLFGCYYHIYRKNSNWTLVSGAACLQVHSGQVKIKISYLKSYRYTYKQNMHLFGCYHHICRKIKNRPPGSGAAGLQVHSGQVKI